MSFAIVTPQEMYSAEQRVFAAGTPSFEVMTHAGESVARHLHEAFPEGRIGVLCGPGGNGGDGFIAASRLREMGREVHVYLLGSSDRLKGDSARAFARWDGRVESLDAAVGRRADITLDALFGGGLSRPLSGAAAQLADEPSQTVSVDVPSGVDGLSARPIGPCFTSALTVTFAAFRPAHVLMPGRGLCGKVKVEDIGVPVPEAVQLNHAKLWEASKDRGGEGPAPASDDAEIHDQRSFEDAFADILTTAGNRIEAVRQAAASQVKVMLVRAASETLIASPEGRCVVDISASAISESWEALRNRIQQARDTGLPLFEAVCKAAAYAA